MTSETPTTLQEAEGVLADDRERLASVEALMPRNRRERRAMTPARLARVEAAAEIERLRVGSSELLVATLADRDSLAAEAA